MANGTTITAPKEGGLNYEDYQKRIQKAAAATRATGTPSAEALKSAEEAAGKVGKQVSTTTFVPGEGDKVEYPVSSLGDVAKAGVASFKQEATAQQQQAEKAASALEMTGESTLKGIQALERIQAGIQRQVESSSDAWGAPAEKADEYVKAARSRVGEVLNKLDQVNEDFAKERSFAKAHAMQTSVQAALGTMRDEERNIAQTYGTDSSEYQQFQMSKMRTLGTVQSNIHAQYQQLAEQQHQTYMNATTDAYTKSNMYVGFQEQQHVEMLKYAEQTKAEYSLRAAELDTSIEQMKMAGMENLANWIIETPSFTMDMTPLMTLISDLQMTELTYGQERALTSAQTAQMQQQTRQTKAWADYMETGKKPYGMGTSQRRVGIR